MNFFNDNLNGTLKEVSKKKALSNLSLLQEIAFSTEGGIDQLNTHIRYDPNKPSVRTKPKLDIGVVLNEINNKGTKKFVCGVGYLCATLDGKDILSAKIMNPEESGVTHYDILEIEISPGVKAFLRIHAGVVGIYFV